MDSLRIDQYLVNKGFFASRTKAHLAIERNFVRLNGELVTHKSSPVAEGDEVTVTGQPTPYVGVGGEKLEAAIRKYSPGEGYIALDIGASTGGFTHCMLQFGAAKVIAVDIGSGQLHPDLQADSRVLSFENTDIREFHADSIAPEGFDVISIDVSFISLEAILPLWKTFIKSNGLIFALLKPQFQMQERKRMRGGIVKSDNEREKAVKNFTQKATLAGFQLLEIFPSSGDGKSKNIEFMIVFRNLSEVSYTHGSH